MHGLWYNPQCFEQTAQGTNGNVQINSLVGPGAWIFNLNPGKEFPLSFIREETKLRFGANIINILNHPVYNLRNATANSATASKITWIAPGARAHCYHDSVGMQKFVVDMRVIF